MGSVLVSIVVNRGFTPRSGQTKDYKIGMCCFSTKPVALRRKNKYRLAQNQNDVSVWGDIYRGGSRGGRTRRAPHINCKKYDFLA
jgi:hypothetical protein